MDFTLLYAAKVVTRNTAGVRRIALSAALGACFAVILPLLGLGGAWATVLKILSGLVLCLIAGRFRKVCTYFKYTGAFLALTALLGGALVGIFTLTGWDYAAGEGYLLSSVPVGIPLFGGLLVVIGARRLAAKFRKTDRAEVTCRIFNDGGEVTLNGFFDSGNKVYLGGEPVSILPAAAAEKLVDVQGIKDAVNIHTVTGSKGVKVFTADRMEIDCGGKIREFKRVKMGVSPSHIDCAVLHPDLAED